MTTPKADAIGRLSALPLCEVLVSLLERTVTGTLVLQERSGRKSALFFYEGGVVKARTPAHVHRGAEPGEALVSHLEWAAALPGSTIYGLYSGTDYIPEVVPAAGSPLALLWRCARHSVDVERVERVITSFEDCLVALHPRATLDRFSLKSEESAAVDPLRRRPRQIGELLDRYSGDPAILCKLIYTLAISRHLDGGVGVVPIGIGGSGVIELPASWCSPAPNRSGARRYYRSSLGIPRASSGLAQRNRRASQPGRAKEGNARGRVAH